MYGNGQAPIFILKDGTQRTRGRTAQSNNIAAAKAVADAVRSTLGPKGMDKMLVDSMGDVVITNDGATILKEMDIEHPAAKMIIEVAKTQEQHCFDGTTSAVILSGELLKRSEDLIEQNVHPTVICEGFRLAAERAIGLMENHGISTENEDTVLEEVAKTALTGKSAGAVKSFMADICVRAVNAVGVIEDGERLVDLSDIKVEKRQGGSIKDSSLIDGILLDKERVHAGMPRSVSEAKIALVNSAIEVKKTEVDAKIQITDPNQLALFLEEEENYIRNLVDTIEKAGANVLVCQKGIDELAQHYLSKKGIFAIRRAKKSDMEALAKATGGTIITNLEDMSGEDLGPVVQKPSPSPFSSEAAPSTWLTKFDGPSTTLLALSLLLGRTVQSSRAEEAFWLRFLVICEPTPRPSVAVNKWRLRPLPLLLKSFLARWRKTLASIRSPPSSSCEKLTLTASLTLASTSTRAAWWT